MNTPATPPQASSPTGAGHGTPASAHASAHGHRKPGHAGAGADRFSRLLMLLSATSDAPGLAPGATAEGGDSRAALPPSSTAAAPPAESSGATLAAMMPWAGRPPQGATDARAVDPGAEPPRGLARAGAPEAGDPRRQGLPRLDRPETLDDPTRPPRATPADGATPGPALAGQDRAPQAPAAEPLLTDPPAPPVPQAAPAAPRAGTAAVGAEGQGVPAGTQTLPQTRRARAQAAQPAQAASDRPPVRIEAGPAIALRSTVTLDERFAGTGTAGRLADSARGDGAAAAPLLPAGPGGGADPGGQPGFGGQASADDPPGAPPAQDPAQDEGAPWSEDLQAAADGHLDAFAPPASLRHASLRVGESEKNAIDIQLSMTGQELDLGFRTDNADVRAALAQHAGSELSDLLQRGGIQLGDVNVSAQNGQSGGEAPSRHAGRALPPVSRASAAGDAAATAPQATAPRPPRRDDNRPLDLFV